jgi:hypothetical protein
VRRSADEVASGSICSWLQSACHSQGNSRDQVIPRHRTSRSPVDAATEYLQAMREHATARIVILPICERASSRRRCCGGVVLE